MIFVIGSGPAGIACAQGLLSAGVGVTLIDPGVELEESRLPQIEALTQIEPSSWTKESTAFLKESIGAGASGIRLKLAYGSDYPYRLVPGATPVLCKDADTKPSYAQGGLSTVWGSAVLPYRDKDLVGWPIGQADLAPGYEAVLDWMPLSARQDDLENLFPLFKDGPSMLPLSRQAQSLLADLQQSKLQLRKQGVWFGASRLAVSSNGSSRGCIRCGLCMFGCPHRLIYSSDLTLRALLSHPKFHYESGLTVRVVSEFTSGMRITAVNSRNEQVHLEGERVFLAAGVLETTSILLRSLNRYDVPVKMKDSPYYLLPLLRRKGMGGVATEQLHTLAQLFVEIEDTAISPYTVHLQTYTYNELFREPVLAALGRGNALFPLNAFLGRLLLFQGYLHSSHSSDMSVTLQHTAESDSLSVMGTRSTETRRALRKLVQKLFRLANLTGLLPLFPMLQLGQPGRGFHSGGTFPMSANPGLHDTDIYGRPFNMRRIHAVDSTVFPSIPATTITFTVMANAYRIGSQLARYA